MKEELPKRYNPPDFAQRIYAAWEKGEFFTPLLDGERPKFSIVIPRPNVTGRLHIGHALVNILQDILVRWKRMSGFNTLWLPGTDHAGIATQMIVERELNKQGISRFDLGREKFVEKVWEWKESYGGQIIDQLKRLGASADWTRLRFTLDEGLARAVRTAFVKLHDDGLIYRGIAIVKVTPAHDKNDYEAGKRNDLQQLQVIGEGGRMNDAAGPEFAGHDRFEARKKVVEMLRDSGALREVRDYTHSIGIHGKCETVIEPMISRQWFVKIEPLAKPATEAVRNGTIRILPQSWEATYFNWMENIHDWTISRQLWWGHRIPAFYCANGHMTVSVDDPASCPQCGDTQITQEPDVLDTWLY